MKSSRQKGRFQGLLAEVPVKVILCQKTALFGAAVCAARLTEGGEQKTARKIVRDTAGAIRLEPPS